MPKGLRNSSRRTSPGCTFGSRFFMTSSVVVDDLHFEGVVLAPFKTDSPAVVDPDAVLPSAVAFQCLQTVPGWNPQIQQALRVVEHPQFPPRHFLEHSGQLSDLLASPDLFSPPGSEGPDHGETITPCAI